MMYLEVFGIAVTVFAGLALMFYRLNPLMLFFSGIGLTIYGATLGLDLKSQGQTFDNTMVVGLGEMFLIFISIIGGALVSTAFNELRSKHQNKG
ncbi:membrane hypothetical protein [Vibrio coralliirubri]|uniref:hypothetical protein n=1 Tax=Vibrio coralliirubri TaxID=1516159 RepID=UPI0006313BFC|nr:hypothetical protein [Vibrio coralliirubri]CDU05645.1 membrane hypothetical protein [Vibrio coralliirubri]